MAEMDKGARAGARPAALIGDVGDEGAVDERAPRAGKRVPVEFLKPNPRNPRQEFFSDEDLSDLASSIRERGIIQPIVVRALPQAGRCL